MQELALTEINAVGGGNVALAIGGAGLIMGMLDRADVIREFFDGFFEGLGGM
jgi:hypothetical protein